MWHCASPRLTPEQEKEWEGFWYFLGRVGIEGFNVEDEDVQQEASRFGKFRVQNAGPSLTEDFHTFAAKSAYFLTDED